MSTDSGSPPGPSRSPRFGSGCLATRKPRKPSPANPRTRGNDGGRGMPGTLVGTINWKSSFNSQKDGDELCVTMKNTWEKRYGGLTIFFLAEKHRDPFDGERSKIVFDEFSKQEYSKRPCL